VNNIIKVTIIEPVGGYGGMNYYDFGLAEGQKHAAADVMVTLYTCDMTNVPPGIPFEIKKRAKSP
jgi:hypothetical protein